MTQVSAHPKHFLSDKVEHFTESVIREMTRQAMQHNAVNLAQGYPDFPAPDFPDLPKDVDKAAGRYPFAQECLECSKLRA